MKRTKTKLTAALALALSLALTSCGYMASSLADNAESKSSIAANSAPALPSEVGYYDDEFEYGDYDPEAAEIATEESAGFTDAAVTASKASALESQKLIYTASVSLDTTDYKKSVEALRSLMASCDAFAEHEDESTYGSQDLHVLRLTLRVPAENYDELIAGMDGIEGTITNRSSQVTNITRSYADNEAIIEGLEIQEERLLDMMEQAETIEDMILVEERLSEVQTELNRARNSRETMDSEVSLSTVSVDITEVRFETTTGETSYLTRVGAAFADMWDGLVEGLGDFGISLIYAIPALVIILVIVLLVVRAARKSRKKQARQVAAQASAAQVAAQASDSMGATE